MNRADVTRLAGAAGMRASTAQPAVNAIGRTVPVEWLEQFARAIEAEVRKEIEAENLSKRQCWCSTCRPMNFEDMRMVLCPDCGNKRCPKAASHLNTCTGSNEPGQPGSNYPAYQPAPGGAA